MHCYRLAQHNTSIGERFQFANTLSAQAMVDRDDGLILDGWVSSKCGVVRGLQIMVVNRRRRELVTLNDLEKTMDGKFRFHKDLSDLTDFLDGDEFAIELSAIVADRSHPLCTLTLVRDDSVSSAVFVVGSPRSGTTIVGDSLRKTLNAEEGFGESHLLPLAAAVTRTVAEYHESSGAAKLPGMMLHHVNPHLLGEQMLSVIKRQYNNLFGQGCILDKTPGGEMIRSLPHIQRLWPEARIIFVKRRGIENVASRLKKFPDVDFETHCAQWKNCMNGWDWVKDKLPHRIEVDQYDVQTQPVAVAQVLGEFLSLTPAQRVQLERHFSVDAPEKTRVSVGNAKTLSMDTIQWSEAQKAFFIEHCATHLQKWGYSLDDSYYQTAAVA